MLNTVDARERKIATFQVRPNESRPTQIGVAKIRALKLGPREISTAEVCPAQVAGAKVGVGEISLAEICSAKVRLPKDLTCFATLGCECAVSAMPDYCRTKRRWLFPLRHNRIVIWAAAGQTFPVGRLSGV